MEVSNGVTAKVEFVRAEAAPEMRTLLKFNGNGSADHGSP
jgi:hypothetical protein